MKTKRGTNTGGPTYDGLGDDLHPGANLLEILDYVISKEDEVPLPELLDFAQSRAKSVTRETLMNTRRSCKAFPRTIRPPGARPGYLQAVYPLRRRPDLAMSFLNTALDSHWGKNALTEKVTAYIKANPNWAESSEGVPVDTEKTDHRKTQWYLLHIGHEAGYRLWVARGDRRMAWRGKRFDAFPLLDQLPSIDPGNEDAQKTVERIDVVWLYQRGGFAAAFEVEFTTGIASGLLRLADLQILVPSIRVPLFIVAPKDLFNEAVKHANRPTFAHPDRGVSMPDHCMFLDYRKLVAEAESLGPRLRHMGHRAVDYIKGLSRPLKLPSGQSWIP